MLPRAFVTFGLACLLVGCEEKSAPVKYTVNDPKDANTTWRTDKPLSYQEAKANGHCPISLPPEAKNIQFVDFYAGYGGFARYVRFEAPAEVCSEHARLILNEHNSKVTMDSLRVRVVSEPLSEERARAFAESAKQGEEVSRAAWFDSDAIRKGEAWGDFGSHMPAILIDLERGVFYYRCTD
jgi:hypothetical protein